MRHHTPALTASLAILLTATTCFAQPDAERAPAPDAPPPPTHERLLGALPRDAASYLVASLPEFFAAGSAYLLLDPTSANARQSGGAFHPVTAAAVHYAAKADAVAFAIAGSEFELPSDLGVGNFNARIIIHTTEPVTAPSEWLDEAGAAIAFESEIVRDIEVLVSAPAPADAPGWNYAGPPYALERRCVALADAHTIVLAETAEDAAEMVLAWRTERAFNPRRFAPALDPTLLDAPLVVLRDGLPATRWTEAPGDADGTLMFAITDVAAPTYTLRYHGTEARAIISDVIGGAAFDKASTGDDGVVSTEWTPEGDEARGWLLYTPGLVFGVVFVI
ncbi:MAG: hypothetical protein R3B68_00345 [Phycisphaerales bacterium]